MQFWAACLRKRHTRFLSLDLIILVIAGEQWTLKITTLSITFFFFLHSVFSSLIPLLQTGVLIDEKVELIRSVHSPCLMCL
jgi:hypothetical protein